MTSPLSNICTRSGRDDRSAASCNGQVTLELKGASRLRRSVQQRSCDFERIVIFQ